MSHPSETIYEHNSIFDEKPVVPVGVKIIALMSQVIRDVI